MNTRDKLKSNILLLTSVITLWLVYTIVYGILRTKPETEVVSGYMSLVGEAGFDFVAAFLCFLLWNIKSRYK